MKSYQSTLAHHGRKPPAASTPLAANGQPQHAAAPPLTANGQAPAAASAPLDLPRPKGRNLRWVIIGIIALLTITNYLDRGNLSVAAPQIMQDLHISNAMMGVVLSAFVWPYAIMNLPTGWAVDRFGVKLLLALAAGLWSVVAILTGFARSVGAFIGLRIALGVSEAPLFPAALKATDKWFPEREKAAATSAYIAATQVGLALAPPVSTLLMEYFGWPAMFIIMGIFGFVALLGWLVVYREPEQHPRLHSDELRYITAGQLHRQEAPATQQGRVSLNEWSRLFRYASTWYMVIGGFCLQYVFWFYISWLPTYLQQAQGFTLNRAGLLSALPYIAGGVAVLIGGRFSDRLVVRGVDPFKARRYTIAGAAVMTALAMFVTAASTGPALAVALLTLGMFTYSLSSGNYWTLAAEAVTSKRLVASVSSIQNFGGFLGGACAPIVTGIVIDRFGGFVPAIVVAGAMAMISALMYGIALRRRLPV
ncbi:MFS transporter [Sodalis endosymbiont of Spalangia cameroni]|uniref:MFS transporter n=1 Tax=Sodalis praecaptivus TaxID=1239307 RepID=UPI0031F73C21